MLMLKLPGIRILMIEMAPEKSLLFLATDISSLNNSCFLHSFHQCHILSRDFVSSTHEWKRLQNMLQKSLSGRQEIWNRLSEQESHKEMSRSKDKVNCWSVLESTMWFSQQLSHYFPSWHWTQCYIENKRRAVRRLGYLKILKILL